MVADQAAKPARHSSWATAGMPNRLAATIRALQPGQRARRPAAGGTGRVPNTRVSWPRPCADQLVQRRLLRR